jgi:hypothetical protein
MVLVLVIGPYSYKAQGELTKTTIFISDNEKGGYGCGKCSSNRDRRTIEIKGGPQHGDPRGRQLRGGTEKIVVS